MLPAPSLTDRSPWYDETTEDGRLRAHWEALSTLLQNSSGEELSARRELVRRQLEELGVTYNVYSDTQGMDRPWGLDLFPFVIPQSEWEQLERGLRQRTRLFNAILNDVYGPRHLVGEGLLPAALVHANPSFLRPCDGVLPAHGFPLNLHATNLARREDGTWCVLSYRTQAPSGLGYALANRIVLSHAMPDEFRIAQVQRLASFFMGMRDSLRALAPAGTDAPSIALLTPGPFNETYFEHSFLARYLGFALVEGGDLVIRDHHVFIKTLEGLRPVDILLRRVDDAFCDPLEFKADSHLGVPGLLNAVRSGHVALVNSLGCTWLESPALQRYMPAFCRRLLGEELLLPAVKTWWCGDASDREHVLANFDSLVIKRSFGASRGPHHFASRLTPEAKEALLADIAFNPTEYVAQERVSLSRIPTCDGESTPARPVVLRGFTCAGPDGIRVLPGGLTRVSTSTHGLIVSMQGGGMSKDTWVLSDGPVSNVSLLRPATRVIRLERAPAEVPSRVADNLFWLGRYAERLEDISRLLRCMLNRLTTESGTEETPELAAMVQLMVRLELFPEAFLERRSLAGIERECVQIVFHAHRLGTIREVHSRLQGLAFSLRDRFSADTQRILSKLQGGIRPLDTTSPANHALEVLNHIVLHLAAFSGMEMENMTRGHAWRFLDMGRRLERSINIITLLQNGLQLRGNDNGVALVPILEIADSVMTYRRRYFGQPQWPTVTDLLIADDSNPRSFAFQVASMLEHVQRLPGARSANPAANREQRLLQSVKKMLSQLDLADLCEGEKDPSADPLPATLGRLAEDMRHISDGITQRFFAHTPVKPS